MCTGWLRISVLSLAIACQERPAVPAPSNPPSAALADAAKQDVTSPGKKVEQGLLFADALKGPSLSTLWSPWLVALGGPEAPKRFLSGGLQLGLDTLARKPGEISVHGLVYREPLDWSEDSVTIRLSLDWLESKNGSYLSAGILLVPEGVPRSSDPRLAERNLALFMTGVPPGALARRVVRLRKSGSTVWEDLQGWPETGKEGREIKGVDLELTVSDDALRVRESGHPELLKKRPVGFSSGRLVLFVASQSNAPLRWGGFRSLQVTRGLAD